MDYARLSSLCSDAKMDIPVAEWHGLLVGYVVVAPELSLDMPEDLLVVIKQSPDTAELIEDIGKSLDDIEGHLPLLLPGDEQPLKLRLQALCDWCRGFLAGLGLGGLQPGDVADENIAEALSDLAEISTMETDAAEDESGEEAYMHIFEYVRTVTQFIALSCRDDGKTKPDTSEQMH